VDKPDFFHKLKGLRVFYWLNKPCVWTGSKLDKKSAVDEGGSFAHSILWIFSSLSTNWSSRQSNSTVEVAGGVEDALRPKSEKFSAGRSVRNASPGLQPKACIQNDGNS